MKNKRQEAKLISSVKNIEYLTNLYFFSETEREAFLIISENKKFLVTDRRYSEEARKKTKDIEIIENGALNFITSVAKDFFKKNYIRTVGYEENNLTAWEYKKLKKLVKMEPLDLKNLRSIKNLDEIKNIKKACKITDEAFSFILTKLKIGVTEKEISDNFISFFQKNNSTFSFNPIVAFGKNSSVPHHKSGGKKLSRNQIVLLDFGVKVNNYCSDMTRTIFFGKADEKFKDIYHTVLEAQKAAIKNIKVEGKASTIDKISREIIKKKYDDIPHALGHGIGLEVHEPPFISPKSKDKIKNNMIFSIEPGIYIPDYGGVRVEDLILVENGKAKTMYKSTKKLIELNT